MVQKALAVSVFVAKVVIVVVIPCVDALCLQLKRFFYLLFLSAQVAVFFTFAIDIQFDFGEHSRFVVINPLLLSLLVANELSWCVPVEMLAQGRRRAGVQYLMDGTPLSTD